MKVELGCSMGIIGTEHKTIMDIDDTEIEDLSEDELDEYILENYAVPFANEKIDIWWKRK